MRLDKFLIYPLLQRETYPSFSSKAFLLELYLIGTIGEFIILFYLIEIFQRMCNNIMQRELLTRDKNSGRLQNLFIV